MRKKVAAFTPAIITCFGTGGSLYAGTQESGSSLITAAAEYEPAISGDYVNAPLFDDTRVHTVNIIITDEEWKKIDEANSESKEYAECDVEIDG